MSNKITIEPTKFENVRTGEVTYGVRVYDDYGATYINTWEAIPDDDMEVLSKVLEDTSEPADDAISAMMNFIEENKESVFIGGEFYEWETICSVFHDSH